MSWIRGFSSQDNIVSTRDLEDAPQAMRQELVDLFFGIAEHNQDEISSEHLYRVVSQSLGIKTSGNPYGGYRYASGRDVGTVDWRRIYDLVTRVHSDFDKQGFGHQLRQGANRIFAAHNVAWELGEDGRLSRVLPVEAQIQIDAAFVELNDPKYSPALALFNAARNAYDDRPRRDRDACTNVFDALESVAKIKYRRPNETFGQVTKYLEQNSLSRPEVVAMFKGLNDLRNRNFGHGMTVNFNLSSAEVDFTYVACVGGILLLVRTPDS